MAQAENTTSRTRDEFTLLVDTALNTALDMVIGTTLSGGTPTRKITRAQAWKAIARRAMRKTTQGAMHS